MWCKNNSLMLQSGLRKKEVWVLDLVSSHLFGRKQISFISANWLIKVLSADTSLSADIGDHLRILSADIGGYLLQI